MAPSPPPPPPSSSNAATAAGDSSTGSGSRSSSRKSNSGKNYSRSEWGSLSIRDRIRAMNATLDDVEQAPAQKIDITLDFTLSDETAPASSSATTGGTSCTSAGDDSQAATSCNNGGQHHQRGGVGCGAGDASTGAGSGVVVSSGASSASSNAPKTPSAMLSPGDSIGRASVVDIWRKRESESPKVVVGATPPTPKLNPSQRKPAAAVASKLNFQFHDKPAVQAGGAVQSNGAEPSGRKSVASQPSNNEDDDNDQDQEGEADECHDEKKEEFCVADEQGAQQHVQPSVSVRDMWSQRVAASNPRGSGSNRGNSAAAGGNGPKQRPKKSIPAVNREQQSPASFSKEGECPNPSPHTVTIPRLSHPSPQSEEPADLTIVPSPKTSASAGSGSGGKKRSRVTDIWARRGLSTVAGSTASSPSVIGGGDEEGRGTTGSNHTTPSEAASAAAAQAQAVLLNQATPSPPTKRSSVVDIWKHRASPKIDNNEAVGDQRQQKQIQAKTAISSIPSPKKSPVVARWPPEGESSSSFSDTIAGIRLKYSPQPSDEDEEAPAASQSVADGESPPKPPKFTSSPAFDQRTSRTNPSPNNFKVDQQLKAAWNQGIKQRSPQSDTSASPNVDPSKVGRSQGILQQQSPHSDVASTDRLSPLTAEGPSPGQAKAASYGRWGRTAESTRSDLYAAACDGKTSSLPPPSPRDVKPRATVASRWTQRCNGSASPASEPDDASTVDANRATPQSSPSTQPVGNRTTTQVPVPIRGRVADRWTRRTANVSAQGSADEAEPVAIPPSPPRSQSSPVPVRNTVARYSPSGPQVNNLSADRSSPASSVVSRKSPYQLPPPSPPRPASQGRGSDGASVGYASPAISRASPNSLLPPSPARQSSPQPRARGSVADRWLQRVNGSANSTPTKTASFENADHLPPRSSASPLSQVTYTSDHESDASTICGDNWASSSTKLRHRPQNDAVPSTLEMKRQLPTRGSVVNRWTPHASDSLNRNRATAPVTSPTPSCNSSSCNSKTSSPGLSRQNKTSSCHHSDVDNSNQIDPTASPSVAKEDFDVTPDAAHLNTSLVNRLTHLSKESGPSGSTSQGAHLNPVPSAEPQKPENGILSLTQGAPKRKTPTRPRQRKVASVWERATALSSAFAPRPVEQRGASISPNWAERAQVSSDGASDKQVAAKANRIVSGHQENKHQQKTSCAQADNALEVSIAHLEVGTGEKGNLSSDTDQDSESDPDEPTKIIRAWNAKSHQIEAKPVKVARLPKPTKFWKKTEKTPASPGLVLNSSRSSAFGVWNAGSDQDEKEGSPERCSSENPSPQQSLIKEVTQGDQAKPKVVGLASKAAAIASTRNPSASVRRSPAPSKRQVIPSPVTKTAKENRQLPQLRVAVEKSNLADIAEVPSTDSIGCGAFSPKRALLLKKRGLQAYRRKMKLKKGHETLEKELSALVSSIEAKMNDKSSGEVDENSLSKSKATEKTSEYTPFSLRDKLTSATTQDASLSDANFSFLSESNSMTSGGYSSSVLSGTSSLTNRAEKALQMRRRQRGGAYADLSSDGFSKSNAQSFISQSKGYLPDTENTGIFSISQSTFSASAAPSSLAMNNAPRQKSSAARLSRRYNTASRFMDTDDDATYKPPIQPPTMAQQASVEVASCAGSQEESFFLSMMGDTVTTATESVSQFSEFSRARGKRAKSGRRQDGIDISSSMASDKFLSSQAANLDAFQKACKGFSLTDIASDWAGEMNILGIDQIASQVNEKLKCVTEKGKQACSALRPYDEEDVAIEVEFMEEDSEFFEDEGYDEEDLLGDDNLCAPMDAAKQNASSGCTFNRPCEPVGNCEASECNDDNRKHRTAYV